jgi:hypothetical protein
MSIRSTTWIDYLYQKRFMRPVITGCIFVAARKQSEVVSARTAGKVVHLHQILANRMTLS